MDTTKESRVARDAFDFSLTLGEAHQNSLAKLMMEGRCLLVYLTELLSGIPNPSEPDSKP